MSTYIASLLLLLLSCASMSDALADTLYKSVGPDGRATYSDRPPADGRIAKTLTFENLPSTPLPAATAADLERLRRSAPALSMNAAPTEVILFSATWCGYCRNAKAYMRAKGIQYQEFDIDSAEGKAAFARAGGSKGVPLLFARGLRVQGFSPAAYDTVFANR